MSAFVTHKLDASALRQLLTGRQGAVARDMLRRGMKVESAAKKNLAGSPSRINTGRLRASITTELVMLSTGVPAARVGTNVSYAIYVHNGTGIFGPRGQMIVPVNRRVLRWRGPSGDVFRPRSRGMQPNHFLTDALAAARD